MEKFNPQTILTKLRYIEETLPVHTWNVNGLKVWPYIRNSLAYSQNQNSNTRSMAGASRYRWSRLKKAIRTAVSLPIQSLQVYRSMSSGNRFFFGATTHCALLDGVLTNKYFDSEIERLIQKGEPPLFFDNSLQIRPNRAHRQILYSLPALFFLTSLKIKLGLAAEKPGVELPAYDQFYEYIIQTFKGNSGVRVIFHENEIRKRLQTLYLRKEFAKAVLAKCRVKVLYFLCYYSSLYYPLLAACYELGIPTVDMQHGGIGRGHYCYDDWSNCPIGGYALLPRFFWTWDTATADLINEWAGKTDFHKAINFGNTWLSEAQLIDIKPSTDKKYVLYNMTEVLLDQFLVNTIKQTAESYTWVLRMHPRQYLNKWRLQEQIDVEGLGDSIIIEDTHQIPLPLSILHCNSFVSKASGSVIECIALGRRPILLRSEIVGYYQHYIDSGKAILLEEDNEQCLISAILKSNENDSLSREAGEHAGFRAFEKYVLNNAV